MSSKRKGSIKKLRIAFKIYKECCVIPKPLFLLEVKTNVQRVHTSYHCVYLQQQILIDLPYVNQMESVHTTQDSYRKPLCLGSV